MNINRRQFAGALVAFGSQVRRTFAATTSLDETLRGGIERRKIPCVTAMVATDSKILYSGAFGKRDDSGVAVKPDSIFAIASMTKAITSTAAMQLVEQGKVTLDEPVSKHLPVLAKLNVLTGFDSAGKPILKPASKPVTLRQLLTHTSGFAYDTWHEGMAKYNAAAGPTPAGQPTPLAFEPGTNWQYGQSTDWTGRLVEAVSGLSLEDYFQKNILKPLGMNDTSYVLPPAKFDRLVATYNHAPDGSYKQSPRNQPPAPKVFIGGGGLFSTTGDYTRFMQMILKRGKGPSGEILKAKTVDIMIQNQTGSISAGKLKTQRPQISADGDFHPGHKDGYALGFLINPEAYDGGRSAGSLAWAGIDNTFYIIDPKRKLCAVIMMQFLPFVDADAVAMLRDFERAVYSSLS